MSNPQNSSSGSGSVFGGGNTSGTGGSLFGSLQNGSASTGQSPFGNPFGGTTANSGSSLFGQPKSSEGATTPSKPAGGSSLFGNVNASTDQTPKSSFSFGNPSTTPVGPPPSQQSTSIIFGGGSGASLFAGNQKQNSQSTETAQTTSGSQSLFGSSAASTSASKPLFGSQTANPQSSLFSAAGSNTASDASKPGTTSLFDNSSATGSKPSTSLFGSSSAASTASPSLFGGASQSSTQTSTGMLGSGSSNQTSTNLFGKPTETGSAGASSTKPSESKSPFSLFGQAQTPSGFAAPQSKQSEQSSNPNTANSASTPPSSLFGAKPLASQSNSTGASMGDTASKMGENSDSQSSTVAGTSSSSTAPSNLFAGLGQSKDKAANAQPAASSSLFAGVGSKSSDDSTPDKQPQSTPASGLFAGLGGSKTTEKPAAATGISSGSLFGSLGSGKPAEAAKAPASTTQTTASAAAPSLFNAKPLGGNKNDDASSAKAAVTEPSSSEGKSAINSGIPSSTSGQPPTAQSRLKNKSMDDIVTRWATDLAKYQKEFQKQAEKVAEWDNIIVKNANTISQLYSKTWQAERDTAEVQKQLSAVEESQTELESWLDRYERDVEDIVNRQMGQGEGISGPDQERERTYKTADRVAERLTDMSSDLTAMIEEINASTAALSKSTKTDDPVSQIVRVLNGHLQQLQQIDVDTQALQAKVSSAQQQSQRTTRSFGHQNGADDFYRSVMSLR